jgi:pimeloyl-ACP methyl ester carboxylesterase
VHILEAGFETPNRPCVLLLHGFPELAYSWRQIMPAVAAAGYHVVAPDARGYGQTTGWDHNYDTDLAPFKTPNLVKDQVGLITALGYRSVAAVCGHDAGSPLASWCALIRPDIFPRVAIMSAPFTGAPGFTFNSANDPNAKRPESIRGADEELDRELAALPRARKHYQVYYRTRQAAQDMDHCPQGLHDFFRAYYYYKSADWKGNKPFPLKARTGVEMQQMPTYYIMDRNKNMCETVAEYIPSKEYITTCRWFTDDDVDVYASEYGRNGFQGALNTYRQGAATGPNDLLMFSGRTIDVPSVYIAGKSDWGVYQAPGGAEFMQKHVCTKMIGFHLVEGAGHWVQQEQPEQTSKIILDLIRRKV